MVLVRTGRHYSLKRHCVFFLMGTPYQTLAMIGPTPDVADGFFTELGSFYSDEALTKGSLDLFNEVQARNHY